MYAIYGNIYHQYTPNVSIYTIHGSYGTGLSNTCHHYFAAPTRSKASFFVGDVPSFRGSPTLQHVTTIFLVEPHIFAKAKVCIVCLAWICGFVASSIKMWFSLEQYIYIYTFYIYIYIYYLYIIHYTYIILWFSLVLSPSPSHLRPPVFAAPSPAKWAAEAMKFSTFHRKMVV